MAPEVLPFHDSFLQALRKRQSEFVFLHPTLYSFCLSVRFSLTPSSYSCPAFNLRHVSKENICGKTETV